MKQRKKLLWLGDSSPFKLNLVEYIVKQDRDIVASTLSELSLEPGNPVEYLVSLRRADRVIIDVRLSVGALEGVAKARLYLMHLQLLRSVFHDEAGQDDESALLLRSHLEHSPLGMLELDGENRITYWSGQCESIFGFDASEAIGVTPFALGMVHPDDIGDIEAHFDNYGDPNYERDRVLHRKVHKNGQVLQVEWFNSLRRDSEGRLQGTLSLCSDRTEEIQGQRELELTNTRLAMSNLASRDGIFDADYERGSVWYSPRLKEIVGHENFDESRNFNSFIELTIPEDRDFVRSVYAEHFKDDSPINFVNRIRRSNGEVVWIKTSAVSERNSAGRVVRVVGSIADITEEKSIEAQLRDTSEKLQFHIGNVLMASVEVDASGRYSLWSDSAEKLFGYTAEEVIGKDVLNFDFVHPEDAELVAENFSRFNEPDFRNWRLFHRNIHKDGRTLYVEWFSSIRRDDDGNMISNLAFAIDRSEQVEVLRQLEASNADLERFANLASHDLQEPARMVASYANLLKSRYAQVLDEDGLEFLSYLSDGAERMLDLIRDVLSYSSLHQMPVVSNVDLRREIEQCLQDLRMAIEENEATVELGSLPVIRCSAPEYAEKIFEMFERLHDQTVYPGTGIGLATCKRIVERHKGQIWAKSELGKGSRFFIKLPK